MKSRRMITIVFRLVSVSSNTIGRGKWSIMKGSRCGGIADAVFF
jgi:hypothetical protein